MSSSRPLTSGSISPNSYLRTSIISWIDSKVIQASLLSSCSDKKYMANNIVQEQDPISRKSESPFFNFLVELIYCSSSENPSPTSSPSEFVCLGLPLFLLMVVVFYSSVPKLFIKFILSWATRYYFRLIFKASGYLTSFWDFLLFNWIPAKF